MANLLGEATEELVEELGKDETNILGGGRKFMRLKECINVSNLRFDVI